MFNDLSTQFHVNVLESYLEYRAIKNNSRCGKSQDIKSGIVAATAMFHFREHLSPQPSVNSIIAACPDYSLLRDVVNASKHGTLTSGNPDITSATSIREQVLRTEYKDDLGDYMHIEKVVSLHLKDGSERYLNDVLLNVINYWIAFLKQMGLFSNLEAFKPQLMQQPILREHCNDNNLDLVMQEGLQFQWIVVLRRFNYTTGKIEPMDLTGMEVEMNIYKPVELDISLSKDGITISKSIKLNREDSRHMMSLATEEEQNKYCRGLAYVNDAYATIARELDIKLAASLKAFGG